MAGIIAGLLIGYVELLRPGLVIPGVVGAVLIMLGVARLAALPCSLLGVAICSLAMGVLIFSAVSPMKWGIAALAAVLLCCGLRMLIGSPDEARIRWVTAVVLGVP